MKVKSRPLKRSYGQWCGIARALDIVGERWTLLIVRNLLVGPKRYGDLLEGLPGIGTNLLAGRLRELEGYGVIERAKLPAPASATVYQLTKKGRELESVVLALGSWGWEYLGEPQPTDALILDSFFVALGNSYDASRDPELDGRYGLQFGERSFDVVIQDGTLTVRQGTASHPDANASTDAATLFALRRRELTPNEAIAAGRLTVDGDSKAFDRFIDAIAWSEEDLERASARAFETAAT